MDIVFVRHGQTVLNTMGRYCGSTDVNLSIDGQKQIKKLKESLEIIKFDCVIVSPLQRTIETAKIIGKKYIIDNRLREMNFGNFEGLTYREVCEKYPSESNEWEKDFLYYKPPDGESLKNVYDRTTDLISDISNKYSKVLVITHGGVIRCALAKVFENPNYFYKFHVGHGTASIISASDNYLFIKSINCCSNITEVL